MKIIVFGATGEVGSRVVREALSRGHEVTAVVRTEAKANQIPAEARIQILDLQDIPAMRAALEGQDLTVSALRPAEGQEDQLLSLTKSVVTAAREAETRVIVVGGAARLKIPGAGGDTVLTMPGFLPEAVVPIARACQAQFDWVSSQPHDADWTYLTPPAMLTPGERTGQYRLGRDELVTANDGTAAISMEDFSVALLDEAETPAHRRTAFTVGY